MKRSTLLAAFSFVLLMLFISSTTNAQLLKRLKQTVKDHIEDRADEKTGEATNNAMDKTDDAVKGNKSSNDNSGSSGEASADGTSTAQSGKTNPPSVQTYKNFDFVPGDQIIFESDLANEETGEIPSQFTVSEGQTDVQQEDGENVIHVPKGAGVVMTPRMTKTTYMPDKFTVELDFKNESFGLNHLEVDFGHRTYYSGGEGITPGMTFGNESVNWTLGDVDYPEALKANLNDPMKWHHISIAVNKNVGKIYVDQFRVANVNNLTGKPQNVTIVVNGYENSFVKNIRIASGGIDIYKETTTPAKIVMHGILFDVDKATLKPQSMGSINEIYNLMKKNPSLKFEIDGHTDNTGQTAHNMTLSQDRADAVKAQLVSMGIDGSRLTTKGLGDTIPMDTNDTPEGKANNRRVEFIKM